MASRSLHSGSKPPACQPEFISANLSVDDMADWHRHLDPPAMELEEMVKATLYEEYYQPAELFAQPSIVTDAHSRIQLHL